MHDCLSGDSPKYISPIGELGKQTATDRLPIIPVTWMSISIV